MELPVVEEARFSFVVNGREVAVVHCTPDALDEFAMGYLYARGIIASRKSVGALGVCKDLQIISATIPGFDSSTITNPSYVTTSCGQSVTEDRTMVPSITGDLSVSMQQLKTHAAAMFKNAVMYHQTGGIHCASLVVYDAKGNWCNSIVREDVGRHNALDKVIGWALNHDIDFSHCVLVTSGRIAFDMAIKVIRAKIPILVSRSIPTTLALETAEKSGITLIGRIEKPEPFVYCGAERICR